MDILNLVQSGANLKLEVTTSGLMKFGEDLIRRTMEEQRLIDAAR